MNLGLRHAVPAVVNALKADPTIASLINPQAIYPIIKTLDATNLPCISVTRVGWSPESSKATVSFANPHFVISGETLTLAINIFARDYDTSNTLAEAVVNSIHGKLLSFNGVYVGPAEFTSASETVVGADYAIFQQSLTLTIQC